MSSSKLLRIRQVLAMTGLSRSSLYRELRAETFPDGVRLGPQSVAWREHEVEAWIAERSPRSKAG